MRQAPAWPVVVNLKADPYEKTWWESEMYLRWYAENTMWIFVPIQEKVKEFFATLPGYPFQRGSSLSAANLNYRTLIAQDALRRLGEVESFMPGYRQ